MSGSFRNLGHFPGNFSRLARVHHLGLCHVPLPHSFVRFCCIVVLDFLADLFFCLGFQLRHFYKTDHYLILESKCFRHVLVYKEVKVKVRELEI